MDESKEDTLAAFQFITGIEDSGKALELLEGAGWKLGVALGMEDANDPGLDEDNITVISNSPDAESVIDVDGVSEYASSDAGSEVSVRGEKKGPLISEQMDDELRGSVMFIDNYTALFGQIGPNFYAGTLNDAVKTAFCQPASKKRLLGIYLHHYESILANIFCGQLLAFDKVLSLLEPHFLVWGWDVTVPWNKRMYHESVERHLGKSVSDLTQHLSKERYPIFLGLTRFKSVLETKMVVYGNVGVEEFLTSLTVSVEEFKEMLEQESREEEARAARQKFRNLQDQAFRESLEIDRAKIEAKRQKLLDETEEKERRKRKDEEDRRIREEERILAESRLPGEPSFSDHVVTLKFRPPSGEIFQRKFSVSSRVVEIFDFLLSKGYRLEEYRVLAGWPRKDLSLLPSETLISDVGFSPLENVILEIR